MVGQTHEYRLGTIFLRNFYTALDFDHDQIAIGVNKQAALLNQAMIIGHTGRAPMPHEVNSDPRKHDNSSSNSTPIIAMIVLLVIALILVGAIILVRKKQAAKKKVQASKAKDDENGGEGSIIEYTYDASAESGEDLNSEPENTLSSGSQPEGTSEIIKKGTIKESDNNVDTHGPSKSKKEKKLGGIKKYGDGNLSAPEMMDSQETEDIKATSLDIEKVASNDI